MQPAVQIHKLQTEEALMIPENRADVDRDIEATLGLVPEFFKQVPDYLIPTEWASFKSLELSDKTAIPNKYKELIGLAVSGATRCRYCCYFHTEAARSWSMPWNTIVTSNTLPGRRVTLSPQVGLNRLSR